MKKWQIATGLVVALVAVLSLSMTAFAQGQTPPAGTAQAPFGNSPSPMGCGIWGAQAGQALMGYGFRFGINGGSLVDVTAKVTGLTTADVVKELQAGKTFADVAKANGKTAADLVNAFLADRKVVLDKAVADGRITQDVADTLLATMKTNIEDHVNGTWTPRGMGYRLTGQQPAQPQFLGPRWSR
jgi:hypothetical protein